MKSIKNPYRNYSFKTIFCLLFSGVCSISLAQTTSVRNTKTDKMYANTTAIYKSKTASDEQVLKEIDKDYGLGDIVYIAVAPPPPPPTSAIPTATKVNFSTNKTMYTPVIASTRPNVSTGTIAETNTKLTKATPATTSAIQAMPAAPKQPLTAENSRNIPNSTRDYTASTDAKFIEPDKGNTDIVMVNTKNLNPLAGKTTISPVEKPELAIPAETKTPDVAEASVEKSKSALNRSAKTSKSNSSVRKVSKAKKSWFSFDFKKSTSKPSKRHYPKGKAACYKF